MWSNFEKVLPGDKSLCLPTPKYYVSTDFVDAESEDQLIRYYMNKTIEHMQLDTFDYLIEPHASASGINQEIATMGGMSSSSPAGTYSQEENGLPFFSYDPILFENPVDLISTLAHEISHHIMHSHQIPIAGGSGHEEIATDLCSIYHGMGIFQLRSSLRMESWMSGRMSGWSVNRSGYLSVNESAYALAVFAQKRGLNNDLILNHLSDMHVRKFTKACKQLSRDANKV